MSDVDTLESIMRTTVAIRRFRDVSIERDLLTEVVQAATYAPSPRNTQPWEFIVVDSKDRISIIGDLIAPRADEVEEMMNQLRDPRKRKMFLSVVELFRTIAHVPAIVFVCGRSTQLGSEFPEHDMVLSAVYTATQNLMLAARARGLGTVFTTLHLHIQPDIQELLSLPDDLSIEVTVPLGWPKKPFYPVRRRPVDEVLHWNRFPSS